MHGDITKGELASASGSFRVQEMGPGLGGGEGRGGLRLNMFLCNEAFKRWTGLKNQVK